MFGLFKSNPTAKLEKEYKKLMKEAMELQRKGDIQGYALKTEQAEKVEQEIERISKG